MAKFYLLGFMSLNHIQEWSFQTLLCYEEKCILSIIADWTPSKWRELSIIASTSENKHRVTILANKEAH